MMNLREFDDKASDMFAAAYSRGLESVADVHDIEQWSDEKKQVLAFISGQLSTFSVIPEPLLRRPEWATSSVVAALAGSAAVSSERTGEKNTSGQIAALVARAARPLLEKLNVKEYVANEIGVELSDQPSLSYIAYKSDGAHLKLHLDTRTYGDVIVLLCLSHTGYVAGGETSATVAISKNGISKYELMPGDLFIMDGPCTPHGRTPVGPNESVSLLSIGYKLGKSD